MFRIEVPNALGNLPGTISWGIVDEGEYKDKWFVIMADPFGTTTFILEPGDDIRRLERLVKTLPYQRASWEKLAIVRMDAFAHHEVKKK